MLVSIGFGSAFQVRTELAASQLELTEERQALESEHYLKAPKNTTSPIEFKIELCKCKITLTAIWPFTLRMSHDSSLQGQKKAE